MTVEMDQMNEESAEAREERRHLENMAAIIAAGCIKFKEASCLIPQAPMIEGMLRESIAAAQTIRDEQARAGTEGKAPQAAE